MNLKKKFILPHILLYLFILPLSGQGIYRPGYLVDNDLDTLRGLIYDGGDMINSMDCKYKVTENGKVSKYKPGEIESYYIDNYRFYKSMKLPLDKDSVVVFAEFLIDGVADIFYFRNINGNHYYVRNEKQEIIALPAAELKKVKLKHDDHMAQFYRSEETGEKYKKDQRYIGILKYSMQDQPTLFSRINNTDLEHKDLINLAEDYHDLACTDDSKCIIFSKSIPDRIYGWGPVIEWNKNFLSVKSEDEENNFFNLPFNEIKLGGSYFTNFPQLNRHIYASLSGLLNISYNTEIPGKTYTYESWERIIILDYEYIWLETQVNLKYLFRTEKKFQPYLSAGTILDIGLKFENYKTEVIHIFHNDRYTENEIRPPHMNKSYIGFNLGTGFLLQLKNGDFTGLKLNYLYKGDFTYVNSFARVKGLNLGAVYYFN